MKLDRSSGNGALPNVKVMFTAVGLSLLIAGGFAIFGGDDHEVDAANSESVELNVEAQPEQENAPAPATPAAE